MQQGAAGGVVARVLPLKHFRLDVALSVSVNGESPLGDSRHPSDAAYLFCFSTGQLSIIDRAYPGHALPACWLMSLAWLGARPEKTENLDRLISLNTSSGISQQRRGNPDPSPICPPKNDVYCGKKG